MNTLTAWPGNSWGTTRPGVGLKQLRRPSGRRKPVIPAGRSRPPLRSTDPIAGARPRRAAGAVHRWSSRLAAGFPSGARRPVASALGSRPGRPPPAFLPSGSSSVRWKSGCRPRRPGGTGRGCSTSSLTSSTTAASTTGICPTWPHPSTPFLRRTADVPSSATERRPGSRSDRRRRPAHLSAAIGATGTLAASPEAAGVSNNSAGRTRTKPPRRRRRLAAATVDLRGLCVADLQPGRR
jgi:hypothetical protein